MTRGARLLIAGLMIVLGLAAGGALLVVVRDGGQEPLSRDATVEELCAVVESEFELDPEDDDADRIAEELREVGATPEMSALERRGMERYIEWLEGKGSPRLSGSDDEEAATSAYRDYTYDHCDTYEEDE